MSLLRSSLWKDLSLRCGFIQVRKRRRGYFLTSNIYVYWTMMLEVRSCLPLPLFCARRYVYRRRKALETIRFRAKKEVGERSSRLGDSFSSPSPYRRDRVIRSGHKEHGRGGIYEDLSARSGASRVYINRKKTVRVNVPDV